MNQPPSLSPSLPPRLLIRPHIAYCFSGVWHMAIGGWEIFNLAAFYVAITAACGMHNNLCSLSYGGIWF